MSRVAVIAPVLGVLALIAVVAIAGGRDDARATAFERVASVPDRYTGQHVRVTGRVVERPTRVPTTLRGTFALAGPQGRRLLVIPPPGETLAPVAEGMRVAVRGRVLAVQPAADEQGPDIVATAGDVATRLGAVAFLRASEVAPRPR